MPQTETREREQSKLLPEMKKLISKVVSFSRAPYNRCLSYTTHSFDRDNNTNYSFHLLNSISLKELLFLL